MGDVSRLYGLIGNMAIKVPCRAATTVNIALSGLQTIDGVALAAGDRVLVQAQTDGTQNGIYSADTGSWTRQNDFDGPLDVTRGTLIEVLLGTSNGGWVFRLDTDNPVIGTSSLSFSQAFLSFTQGGLRYLTGVAGTNTITASASPTLGTLLAGQRFQFIAAGQNTGAVTLAIDATGAKPVVGINDVVLTGGEIKDVVDVLYDGTKFYLLSYSALSASGGSALVGHIDGGTGAVAQILQDYLRRQDIYASQYGAVGDWNGTTGTDDTVAIQAAITAAQQIPSTAVNRPRRVILSGHHKITAALQIGNGTNAAGLPGWSTVSGIELCGPDIPSGIGNYAPLGGASLITVGNINAVQINGPITGGWGVRNLYIDTSSATAGSAIAIVEGQFGCVENVNLNVGAYGITVTTWGNNLAYGIDFHNVGMYLNPAHAGAVGMVLTGTAAIGSGLMTINGLTIIPGNAGHTGVILQATDSNVFTRYNYMDAAFGSKAVVFDYSIINTYPTANFFYQFDPYGASVTVNGSPNEVQEMAPNRILLSQTNGAVIPEVVGVAVERTILGDNKSVYVATTGSDTTGTGYSGNPFATIQHAYDHIISHYDLANHTATIQCAAGTYTAGITASVKPQSKANIILDLGTGTLSTTSASAVIANGNATLTVQNGTIQTTTSGFGILATSGAFITVGASVTFGACADGHTYAQDGGEITFSANYSITGAAPMHWQAGGGGKIKCANKTLTITGTPAFSAAFAACSEPSMIWAKSNTYSGSATGVRYTVALNGVITTGGATLPGNVAGSTATGGQYA